MTSEDIQRYVRISIYWAAGYFANKGMGVDGSTVDFVAAIAVTAANLAWSRWGMRLNGKIAELAKYGDVKKIVATPEIANVALAENPKVIAK